MQCTKKCVKPRLSISAESHPDPNPRRLPDCVNELITTIDFWRTMVVTLPLCSPKEYHPYGVQISLWSPSPRAILGARQRVAWSPKRFLARSPEHLLRRPKAWKHRWRERLPLEDPLHWITKIFIFSLCAEIDPRFVSVYSIQSETSAQDWKSLSIRGRRRHRRQCAVRNTYRQNAFSSPHHRRGHAGCAIYHIKTACHWL